MTNRNVQAHCKPTSLCLLPSGLLQQEAEKYACFIHSIDFTLEQRQT